MSICEPVGILSINMKIISFNNRRILHIEDEEIVLAMFAERMVRLGAYCEAIRKPEEVGLVEVEKYDVVILDVNFKGSDLNGYDCISILKSKKPDVDIIIYSQHDQRESLKKAYNLGVRAWITKAETFERLIEVMQYVFNGISGPLEDMKRVILTNQPVEINRLILSDVEMSLAKIVSRGSLNSPEKIAKELNISIRKARLTAERLVSSGVITDKFIVELKAIFKDIG